MQEVWQNMLAVLQNLPLFFGNQPIFIIWLLLVFGVPLVGIGSQVLKPAGELVPGRVLRFYHINGKRARTYMVVQYTYREVPYIGEAIVPRGRRYPVGSGEVEMHVNPKNPQSCAVKGYKLNALRHLLFYLAVMLGIAFILVLVPALRVSNGGFFWLVRFIRGLLVLVAVLFALLAIPHIYELVLSIATKNALRGESLPTKARVLNYETAAGYDWLRLAYYADGVEYTREVRVPRNRKGGLNTTKAYPLKFTRTPLNAGQRQLDGLRQLEIGDELHIRYAAAKPQYCWPEQAPPPTVAGDLLANLLLLVFVFGVLFVVLVKIPL